MHLTNVAIQKKGRGYNAVHGGKWSTRYLRLFVDGTRGPGSGDALFRRIEQLIVHSLKAVQPVIVHNKVSKRVLSSLTILCVSCRRRCAWSWTLASPYIHASPIHTFHFQHCFECYGYDVLVDDMLKPYLIEVNASPSLSSTTVADRQLKTQVIGDILDVVACPAWYGEEGLRLGANSCTGTKQVGGFKLIFDEAGSSREE